MDHVEPNPRNIPSSPKLSNKFRGKRQTKTTHRQTTSIHFIIMVEIEEIQEVEPESTATDAEGPTNPEDEWEKLMGEDLVMKVK